jgi:hypothetical protein
MDPDIVRLLQLVLPIIAIAIAVPMIGVFANTWLRIKHGYPLDGAWGKAVYPKADRESQERIKLLTSENAQLRAEVGSLKDRMETIERIITDQPSQLEREIDALKLEKGENA